MLQTRFIFMYALLYTHIFVCFFLLLFNLIIRTHFFDLYIFISITHTGCCHFSPHPTYLFFALILHRHELCESAYNKIQEVLYRNWHSLYELYSYKPYGCSASARLKSRRISVRISVASGKRERGRGSANIAAVARVSSGG